MAKLYTSPLKVPLRELSGSLRNSGAVQNNSEREGAGRAAVLFVMHQRYITANPFET